MAIVFKPKTIIAIIHLSRDYSVHDRDSEKRIEYKIM